VSGAPVIMAIDAASTVGVAEGRAGEVPRLYSIKFSRKDDVSSTDVGGRVMAWFQAHLEEIDPDVVYIEAPLSPGAPGIKTNPSTTMLLIGLSQAMAYECKARGWVVRMANVQTVRRDFIGSGRVVMPKGSKQGEGGKEAKRRVFAMCELLGWNPPDRDAADAGALWWYGVTRFAPDLAAPITPMMWGKCATTIRGVDVGGAETLFKKACA
jgi:hypothetical protein